MASSYDELRKRVGVIQPTKVTTSSNFNGGSSYQKLRSKVNSSSLPSLSKLSPLDNYDLNTIEGLSAKGIESGYEDKVNAILNKEPKLSLLQRLGKGLGAFNPAEAVMTGVEKGVGAGLIEYPKNIIQGVGSALTGKDYEEERRTFSDVAEKMGIENGIAKFGIGIAGDILLDPTTYFGGAMVKGLLKGTQLGANVALKTTGRVAPKVEEGLRMAGTGLQDAMGRAFVYGYGTTKGLAEDMLSYIGKVDKTKLGIASSNLERLGTGTLSKTQQEELALKLLSAKRAEYELTGTVQNETIDLINKTFPDLKVTNPKQAKAVLDQLENVTQNRISKIRENIDNIVAPIFKARQEAIKKGTLLVSKTGLQKTPAVGSYGKIDELNRVVEGLKGQLKEIRASKSTAKPLSIGSADSLGGEVTPEELVNIQNKLLNYEEERLANVVDDLSSKIEKLKMKPDGTVISGTGSKIKKMSPEETIIYGERLIQKLQEEIGTKSQMLETIVNSRKVAKETLKKSIESGDFSKVPPELVDALKVESDDPIVQKLIAEQSARSQKFAKGAGIDDPFSYYFPSLRKESLANFVDSTKSLRIGSEGYLKQFKNLLKDEDIILDPAEAFAKREFEMAKDSITRDTISSIVKKYGKSLDTFANQDEATKAGYSVIKEKGLFGKDVGYIKEADKRFLMNQITPEFATINKLARATGYDAITGLFKRSVTGLFPPFHIRNYVSGHLQNFEALGPSALLPENIIAGHKIARTLSKGGKFPDTIIDVAGKKINMGKAMKAFSSRFGGDSSYVKDIADITSGEKMTKLTSYNPLSEKNLAFRSARAIGSYIETQQKATAFITALKKGMSIDQALGKATMAGFDYRALTPFEGSVLRRIVPFYSFTRKNIELQLKTLGENPQRINQILAVLKNTGDKPSAEENKYLPQYLKDSLGIKISDTPEGLMRYISSFGTPVEAFAELFNGNPILKGISMMNPMLKVPIELGTGVDSFRQKDVKEVYDAREYSGAPQILKDLLDIKEVQAPILKKDSKGKLKKVGERTQYVADPERLLIARSLFTSRGFNYLDQIFDGDMTGLVKAIKLTTGIKPQIIDLNQQQEFTESQQKQALIDMLKKYKEIAVYKRAFEPKE